MTIITLLLIAALIIWGGVLCRGVFVASDNGTEMLLWGLAAAYTFCSAITVAWLGIEAGVL